MQTEAYWRAVAAVVEESQACLNRPHDASQSFTEGLIDGLLTARMFLCAYMAIAEFLYEAGRNLHDAQIAAAYDVPLDLMQAGHATPSS